MSEPHCGRTVFNFGCKSCFERLSSDVTRLKAELDEAHQAMKGWDEGARKDKAEIDRLKGELERYRRELSEGPQGKGRSKSWRLKYMDAIALE